MEKRSDTPKNNFLPQKKIHTRLKLGILLGTSRLKGTKAGENGSGFDLDLSFDLYFFM